MPDRHDFTQATKDILFKRVNGLCSNTQCRQATSGPASDPDRVTSVGVAAHITAASPGGPRYDEALSEVERRSSENGIWLWQLLQVSRCRSDPSQSNEVVEAVFDELYDLCHKMVYMAYRMRSKTVRIDQEFMQWFKGLSMLI